MSDDKLNPHTGQPMPDDPKPQEPRAPNSAPASDGGRSTETRSATSSTGSEKAAGADNAGATASGERADASSGSEAAAPSQQEIAIRSALESVMDPEINLSVVDLGLIREVHILPEKTHIRMMLTTPFCPYAPQLVEEVKNATLTVRAQPVDVELMPDAWSPDMMPDPSLLGYSF